MRRVFVAIVSLVALAIGAPAGAVINGEPDGNRHPAVGALLAPQAYSDGTWVTCTGTLISPTVFLTAAHCDQGVSRVGVTFDSEYESSSGTVHWGDWHADPNYTHKQNDPHDLAVVVLDLPVFFVTPAELPEEDSLSDLPPGSVFTSVGYGAQSVTNGPGGKTYSYEDVRYMATGTLNSIQKSWLKISQNAAKGDGGTCYGDSGGPNFLGAGADETNVIASTTITGDSVCRSTNVTYRLDTASARSFLGDYVTLP